MKPATWFAMALAATELVRHHEYSYRCPQPIKHDADVRKKKKRKQQKASRRVNRH